MKRITFNKFLLTVGMVCAAGQMYALPLAPGGTVLNPALAAPPAGSPIAVDPVTGSQGGLNNGYNWKTGPGQPNKATGNYVNAVYTDPVSHQLDFYYQIQNTFKGTGTNQNTIQATFSITDFGGFAITDVRQLQDPAAGNFFGDGANVEFKGKTTQTITKVTRSANGSVVTVTFSGVIKPGQNTAVLLLKTNAVNFDQGTSQFNFVNNPSGCSPANVAAGNCGNAYTQPFQLNNLDPVLAPEPGFYGMLSLGVGGLFLALRRRSRKVTV